MGMKRVPGLLICALLVAAVAEAWLLHRAHAWNREIVAETQPGALEEAPAEVVFAHAKRADRAGDFQSALNLYKLAEGKGSPRVAQGARYNSANLYFREALALRETTGVREASPMAELAKESYRKVLREEPRHWDAKYNFERVLRAFPDWGAASDVLPPQDAERAITTMKGYTLGLP